MDTKADDPVVIGGRCQGAPTAMLCGQLREAGRVIEVTSSAGRRRARLVVRADGRNSLIARLAGPTTYCDHPPVTFACYTRWHGGSAQDAPRGHQGGCDGW